MEGIVFRVNPTGAQRELDCAPSSDHVSAVLRTGSAAIDEGHSIGVEQECDSNFATILTSVLVVQLVDLALTVSRSSCLSDGLDQCPESFIG